MDLDISWKDKNFNTSHVTVYRRTPQGLNHKTIFQYISCYCLSCVRWFCKTCKQISIHLMLLFITSLSITAYQLPFISIHLMLLFISVADALALGRDKFQYISCYCLSSSTCTSSPSLWISIHLMLLFIRVAF